MKLKEFRVRGFRCIHDTGVIKVSDATTLIGKNESGKTAILGALVHLNRQPAISDQDICDELVDRLAADERIVEGRFELSDPERDLMQASLPGISQLTDIVIYRTRISEKVEYEFPGAKFPKKFACDETAVPAFVAAIEQLKSTFAAALPGAPVPLQQPAEAEDVQEESAKTTKAAPDRDEVLDTWSLAIETLLAAQPFEFKSADSNFKRIVEIASPHIKGKKGAGAAMEAAKKAFKELFIQDDYQAKVAFFFGEKLHPRLLYFPDYKVIDGIIDVAAYIGAEEQAPKRSDTGYQFGKAETVRNLFHLAQLDPKELEGLAKAPPRLASFLNRCSDRLTEMLALTWKSKKIDVRLHYTNGTVTVEVGDIYLDGTTKNRGLLDRRSAGFKWHFSFFVNFRAGIQQTTFKDAILLLDEPGLNLHPEQQGGLIDVIRDLSETNQVLYTTHSPFMIHNFATGSLLTVEFDPDTKASKIKTNFWEGDWQTIRPILHAIGDRMLLRVFRGAESFPVLLIVEGATDQRYIAALSTLDDEDTAQAPLAGAEPVPAGGHTEVHDRAWFYFKRKRKVIALFDSEPDAIAESRKLIERGFPENQTIIIEKADKEEADIEDLFTEEDFLNAVNAFYGRKLRNARAFTNITKTALEKIRHEGKPVRVVKALEALFLSRSTDGWGRFDKSGVCDLVCERLAKGELKISKKSRERFEGLFRLIEKAVKNAIVFGAKTGET